MSRFWSMDTKPVTEKLVPDWGLMKIREPEAAGFRSVRVVSLYDAVTTRVFPNLKNDRMALKLNGKNDGLRRADFRKLAATAGLRARASGRRGASYGVEQKSKVTHEFFTSTALRRGYLWFLH